jgi:NitT/TauT family transport system ATP-binding protein
MLSAQDTDGRIDSAPLLVSESVSICFDGQRVLDSVDFSLDAGEFVSILGPSGCGKTTVLRLVAGLAEPTSGKLAVQGEPRTAFVFQEPNLLPWRDVIGNVRLPLELLHVDAATQDRAIDSKLRMSGLTNADYRKYPRMLSGGMKMRVSLARAMVTNPDILLLDEPFAAVDDLLRHQLNEELLRIWLDQQWTALFVTHNVNEAVFLSQRILIMGTRPGSIIDTIRVPFPYPRSPDLRGDPEFTQLTLQISRRLRENSA